jgi:hypothetical protein
VGDHLAVRLAFEVAAARFESIAQLLEVLNDAIVHQRQLGSGVRVRVGGGRRAVSGPTGMGDSRGARRRVDAEFLDQIDQLALRASTHQFAFEQSAHAGAVIAAVFHPA